MDCSAGGAQRERGVVAHLHHGGHRRPTAPPPPPQLAPEPTACGGVRYADGCRVKTRDERVRDPAPFDPRTRLARPYYPQMPMASFCAPMSNASRTLWSTMPSLLQPMREDRVHCQSAAERGCFIHPPRLDPRLPCADPRTNWSMACSITLMLQDSPRKPTPGVRPFVLDTLERARSVLGLGDARALLLFDGVRCSRPNLKPESCMHAHVHPSCVWHVHCTHTHRSAAAPT